MSLTKLDDPRSEQNKTVRELYMREMTDMNKMSQSGTHDRIPFIWDISLASIVRQRDPAALSDYRNPR